MASNIDIVWNDQQLKKYLNRYEQLTLPELRLAIIESMQQVGIIATKQFMHAAKVLDYETGDTIGIKGPILNIRSSRLARSLTDNFSFAQGATGAKEGIRNVKITANKVISEYGSKVPYAAIHEYGGTTHPRVTPKMRGFMWRRYRDTGNPIYRGIALTQKSNLTINIPPRPYLNPALQVARGFIDQRIAAAMNTVKIKAENVK